MDLNILQDFFDKLQVKYEAAMRRKRDEARMYVKMGVMEKQTIKDKMFDKFPGLASINVSRNEEQASCTQ